MNDKLGNMREQLFWHLSKCFKNNLSRENYNNCINFISDILSSKVSAQMTWAVAEQIINESTEDE